jgi:hypothetical protein
MNTFDVKFIFFNMLNCPRIIKKQMNPQKFIFNFFFILRSDDEDTFEKWEIKFYFYFFPALLSICRSRKARETSNKKGMALLLSTATWLVLYFQVQFLVAEDKK